MDTWLLLRNLESGGERNRGLYILKSRGMAHSNQVREFVLCDQGIKLVDPYIGMGTVLTGSARVAQEARERAEALAAEENNDRERAALEARVAALQVELKAGEAALERLGQRSVLLTKTIANGQAEMSRRRGNEPAAA